MITSIQHFRGQPLTIELAGKAQARGLLQGTLLFCGSRGLGKSTLAMAVGLAVNCEQPAPGQPLAFCGKCYACRSILAGDQPEFLEIRPIGQDIKVEQFEGSKSLAAKEDQEGRHEYSVFHAALMAPAYIKRRVFLIDEAHYLNRSTGNQLLKLLEEAPPQTMFLLITDKPQLLLPTILSRARRFDLTPIPLDQLAGFVEADVAGIAPEVAAEAAYLAAGRYVDAVALAADPEWRDAVNRLAESLVRGGLSEAGLDQLVQFELNLLLRAEFPRATDPSEEAAELPVVRRNELRRQATIGAIDRAAWSALRRQSPASDFSARLAKLKARINQNVDPGLATAAFSEASHYG